MGGVVGMARIGGMEQEDGGREPRKGRKTRKGKRKLDRKIKGQKNKEQEDKRREDKGREGYLSSLIRAVRVIRGLFISSLFFCPSFFCRKSFLFFSVVSVFSGTKIVAERDGGGEPRKGRKTRKGRRKLDRKIKGQKNKRKGERERGSGLGWPLAVSRFIDFNYPRKSAGNAKE